MPAGTVTAIRQQNNDPQRVNVFIDGEFALGISLNTLARERLKVGVYLDESAWKRLVASEQADQALQQALRQLERRARSTAEIQRYLQRKGFSEPICAQTITRLRELGLLDDIDFAGRWIANRRALRPRGERALRAELRQKGIDPVIIEQALAADDSGMTEAERTEAAARAALPRYSGLADWVTFQRRLGGYLLRRGFAGEHIHPILINLWRELHPTSDIEEL
ncbi:RecX family transcriptional regulator [Chloroflexus sp.]|uniref:RecX family transcriptional regulator n=1 Tax=Chloroflexus sp. TaxID=1904827 RepID=UPI0026296B4B|nr:RecX family transcriptional regulator [uncultured Chloroflexus sp.]